MSADNKDGEFVHHQLSLTANALFERGYPVCMVCSEMIAIILECHEKMCAKKFPDATPALISKVFMDCAGDNCSDYRSFLQSHPDKKS